MHRIFLSGLVVLVLSLSACGSRVELNGNAVVPPEPAAALDGTNWDGKPFSMEEVRGRVTLVFFGYTFCPDVCPLTLAKMKQVTRALGDRAEDFAVIFVSVDSKRDSVEKLAEYVPGFDPRFYGLRLEVDELEAAIEGWDLTVQIGQPKDGPGTDSYYYVDHTGTYFVVDQEGQLRVTYPPNAKVEDLLADIETLLAE